MIHMVHECKDYDVDMDKIQYGRNKSNVAKTIQSLSLKLLSLDSDITFSIYKVEIII